MSTGTADGRPRVEVGHEQLMAVIDHTSAVIYMRDADGRYLLVNHEYERLFRLHREDIVGLTDHDLFPRPIADQFRHNDLEMRVRQCTAELEASTRELDAFAYSVSHDLRAPLRSLEGFSQVLLEDYSEELDEDAQGYLRRIQANVGRMAQMIDDLLHLSRATRSPLRREPTDLSALAREVVHELVTTDPGRTVDFVIPDGLHTHLLPDDGSEGLHPALVLLDVKLPKIDGLEVLRRIRDDERTRHRPVVVLTTSNEESDVVTSYRLGANSFVRKSVVFEEFVAAVNALGVYWLLIPASAR